MKKKTKKWLVPAAVGAVAVGVFTLAAKKANAAPNPPPGPLPPTPPGPSPGPKPPKPFPPNSALAQVIPNAKGGVNTRTGPDPGEPMVAENDAFNGATVAVLKTGIPSTSPQSKEWWQIITPGGSTGFASAVGSGGESNFRLIGSIPLPGPGGLASNGGGLEEQLPGADGNSGGGPVELPPDVVAGVTKHFSRPWNPFGWR